MGWRQPPIDRMILRWPPQSEMFTKEEHGDTYERPRNRADTRENLSDRRLEGTAVP